MPFMSRRVLDLGAFPWQFGSAERQPFSAQPVDDRTAVTEWLPARVPGDVRADLIAAGRIPPVDTPEGIAAGEWVDEYDWWYRVTLPGGLDEDEMAVLEADGIDYYSAIWLGDRLMMIHAGMFARQVVTLSPWINTRDNHELAIRIWGGGALPRQPNPIWRRAVRRLIGKFSPDTEYFPDRMTTPKAQFSFGWDFAPRVLSAGIWDEIRLVVTRGAYIEDLWATAEPLMRNEGAEEQGREEAGETVPARFAARLLIRQWQVESLRAEVIVEPKACTAPAKQETFDLNPDLSLNLDLPSAHLWWPWDQGEPCLYRVTVRLLGEKGVLDEASRIVGVRSVARTAFPNGAPAHFLINGRPVFLRGANWAPVDILPGRATDADYARLLGQARAAGVNFLRVWGGGIREKRGFWEMCDRLGIMAWQEFPLACAFLDHHPRNRTYLNALTSEARGIVRMLRSHPSLIAWCGGNEINPARERLPLAAIQEVLAHEDPGRPWLPASPAMGDVHRWDVWHGFAPWTALRKETASLVSEFGLQALPDAATVAEMFVDGIPTALADPRWVARKAQTAKLHHYAGPDSDRDLKTAIVATQRAQATGLQIGIEACRLRRETQGGIEIERSGKSGQSAARSPVACVGVAFWQFNEPWPAASWAIIDRAGRPKLAYKMLRRAFQPVLVAARFQWQPYRAGERFAAEVWLVNDGAVARPGCRVEVRLDGQVVWARDGMDLPAAGARPIGQFTITLGADPAELALTLAHDADILAHNRYDLAVHLPIGQPLIARLRRGLADWLLRS